MTTERIESVEEIKARIAAGEAAQQAKLDERLAEFDKQVAARKAKAEVERQAEQQKRQQAEHAEAEARFEREHMAPARAAWLANGGTLEEFEKAKPQLRQEKLAELALRANSKQQQWRNAASRRYR